LPSRALAVNGGISVKFFEALEKARLSLGESRAALEKAKLVRPRRASAKATALAFGVPDERSHSGEVLRGLQIGRPNGSGSEVLPGSR
jgi:hypothetical protein